MNQVTEPNDCMTRSESQAFDELRARLSAETVLRRNEPLAKRTMLRVGGPADVFVEPASGADLAAVLRICGENKMPFFVLGRGSNLLGMDGGFRGIVISLAQPHFSRIEVAGQSLICGAGARLKAAVDGAQPPSRVGLGRFECIPRRL